jgi:ABC-type transport system involved in cytochrome c biogenesis permease subunit
MPTVINNPSNSEGSGTNLVTGVTFTIVILAAIVLFFMYGLPMIRNISNSTPTPANSDINVNVKLPTNTTTTPVTNPPMSPTTPSTQTP